MIIDYHSIHETSSKCVPNGRARLGVILVCMRKLRSIPQAMEHENVDDEDIDEILEDVILIDDFEEELEDQGYFNDEEHSLSIT